MQVIKENCYKGTRILLGNLKRDMINEMIRVLRLNEFDEIQIPIIQSRAIFVNDTSGNEAQQQIFAVTDNSPTLSRLLVLAPEYTRVLMNLKDTFAHKKDVKLFYVQECFRGEKPQAGRYRQFTQLGVEILNPTQDHTGYLSKLAQSLIHLTSDYSTTIGDFDFHEGVTRGLEYYTEGSGFEITCNKLGAQKQVCGGGAYPGGIGFALGIDRLLLLRQEMQGKETQ